MDRSLEKLLRLEHQGWEALSTNRGGTFYGDLMTEDGVMILVNGMVLDRATIAGSLDDSPAWSSYSISEPRTVDLGPDAVALVYRAEAERDGVAFTALMTSVYRAVDGRPRLALYQQTTATH